jgi:hypothetical protein
MVYRIMEERRSSDRKEESKLRKKNTKEKKELQELQ